MIMNNIVLVSCLEIGIFCIAILLIILNTLVKSNYKRMEQFLSFRVIVSILVYTSLNICKVFFLNFDVSLKFSFAKSILAALYYPSIVAMSMSWFIYSEYTMNLKFFLNKKLTPFLIYPTLFSLVLSSLSLKTGWIFDFTKGGNNHGSFFWAFMSVPLLLMIIPQIQSLKKITTDHNSRQNSAILSVLLYSTIAVIFSLLQIFFNNLPILCVMLTLSVLKNYMMRLSRMVSLDPLTNISNRYQYELYISDRIKKIRNDDERLFLFLIDINCFKKINDTYGHTEGDRALITVANSLKKISEHRNAFISRYDGDEFILLFTTDDELDVLNLKVELQDVLFTMSQNLPYTLMINTGIAEYKPEYKNAAEFLSSAETELCKIKKRRS